MTFEKYCEEPYFIAKLDKIIRESMRALAKIGERVEDNHLRQSKMARREADKETKNPDAIVDLLDA